MKPNQGYMYHWRQKGTLTWRFGYCMHLNNGLVRMGAYNGDTMGGSVVDPSEIEWRAYA